MKNDAPQRMEVWYASIPLHDGSSIQGGSRPVVIVSNDICNSVSTVLTIAPMTRRMKKLSQPTHALIEAPDGQKSVVLVEQIILIDKGLLTNRMGKVKDEDVAKIEPDQGRDRLTHGIPGRRKAPSHVTRIHGMSSP